MRGRYIQVLTTGVSFSNVKFVSFQTAVQQQRRDLQEALLRRHTLPLLHQRENHLLPLRVKPIKIN